MLCKCWGKNVKGEENSRWTILDELLGNVELRQEMEARQQCGPAIHEIEHYKPYKVRKPDIKTKRK